MPLYLLQNSPAYSKMLSVLYIHVLFIIKPLKFYHAISVKYRAPLSVNNFVPETYYSLTIKNTLNELFFEIE